MPCRPGLVGCRSGCLHRSLVHEYRAERHRQELDREAVTGNYATELAEHPGIVTFRQWLEARRR